MSPLDIAGEWAEKSAPSRGVLNAEEAGSK